MTSQNDSNSETVHEILEILTGFEQGQFTQITRLPDDPTLAIIVAKLNATAAALQATTTAAVEIDKFFEMSLDILCIAGPDATFKKVNPAFTQVLGYSSTELLSKPFLEFIHPDDIAVTLKEVEKLARGVATIHFENRYRHQNGTFRILSWSASPDVHSGMLYAAARDVTEQRQSENQMRQLLTALNSSTIVTVTDTKGTITEANDKFCELSGYSRSELVGQNHRILNSGAHSKEFFKDLWQTIASGNNWSGVLENRNKSGQSYWVYSVLAPTFDLLHKISGYLAIRVDVTALKNADAEIQSLSIRLAEAEALAKIGFWEVDLTTKQGKFSSGQKALFGLPSTDSPPSIESFMAFIHPEDRNLVSSTVPATLSAGAKEFKIEYRIVLPIKNEVRWLRDFGKIELSPEGIPVKITGSSHDITDFKLTELELKKTVTILNATGKIAKIGGWELDPKTGSQVWTDETFRIFDMDVTQRKEPYLKEGYELFTPLSKPLIEHAIQRTIEFGESYSLELEAVTEKGRPIWIHAEGMAILEGGKTRLLAGTVQDVTEARTVRLERERVTKQLSEAQSLAKIGSYEFNLRNHELTWSSEHYKIFEIPEPQPQETLFALYRSRIHPEDLGRLNTVIAQAGISGDSFVFDHRLLFAEGRIKYVQGIGHVSKDSLGIPEIIIGTCQDLTERIQQDAESHFVTSALDLGIWKFDPINGSLEWDESMYRLFGVSPSEFSGAYQAWENALTPAAKNKAVVELQQALSGEREFNTTFEIQLKSGETRHIAGRGKVIRNDRNEPVKMYGVNFDVTARVVAEQRLVETQKQLELQQQKLVQTSKLASLGEMSAGIAHEINNPLAIIYGNLSLLINGGLRPDQQSDRLHIIQKSSERIAKIVKGLKKFSRVSERGQYLKRPLAEIVREAIVLVDAKFKQHDTQVILDLQSEATIMCEELEIEQVMINLLSNAVDAVKSLEFRCVRVQVQEDAQDLVLRITDSGNGISKDIQAKLFDPFFTTKGVGEGTGLGLSITKGILDEHQASIEVLDGTANTCFEIRFKKHDSAQAA